MTKRPSILLLHGLEGSSQGFKATFLRSLLPEIVTPDFEGSLEERMAQLDPIINDSSVPWVIIGSSFGGLMATLAAGQYPQRVRKLILLAPALTRPFLTESPPDPIAIPTVIYHGMHDTVVPLEPVQQIAEQIFTQVAFHVVDDDHALHQTVQTLDWLALVDGEQP